MSLTKVQKEGIETLINNNADNRVITGSGTANTLEGESNLTFNGTALGLTGYVDVRTGSSINTNSTSSAHGALHKNTNSGEFAIVSGGTGGDNHLSFYTSASAAPTEKLRIDSSGHLLVNTTSVGGGSYDQLSVAGGIKITDDSNSKLEIGRYSSGAPNSYIKIGSNSNSLRITNASDNSDLFTVNNDGKIGIGTSPQTPLHVYHATSNESIRCESGDEYVHIVFKDSTTTNEPYIGAQGNNLRAITGGAERMRIDSSGNLVVGGTSAQASDSVTLRQDGEVTAAGFYFTNNIGSPMNSDGIRRATTSTMVFDTNSTERMRIDSQGRVMIGTTNASSAAGIGIKLAYGSTNPTVNTVINQSAGNHSFYHLYNTNSTNNGYRFYVQANGGIANHSGNNVNLSDERMKKNITNMGSVYNIFKQFVFKDFNYISDNDSDAKKHGVIAQEVETIDSDLITEDFKISGDNDENYVYRKALKEEQFVMIGLKTLQEAIAKIEVLETKVAALEGA